VNEAPFDSLRKRMTTVHDWAGCRRAAAVRRLFPYMAFTKGATDLVLERCTHILDGEVPRPLTEADRKAAMAANDAMADQGAACAGGGLPAAPGGRPTPGVRGGGARADPAGAGGMIDPPRRRSRRPSPRPQGRHQDRDDHRDHRRTAHAIADELGMFTPAWTA